MGRADSSHPSSPGKKLSYFLHPQHQAGDGGDPDGIVPWNRNRLKNPVHGFGVNDEKVEEVSRDQTGEQPVVFEEVEAEG